MKIILFLMLSFFSVQCQVSEYSSPDFRFTNFNDSSASSLAIAVQEEDVKKIKEILAKNPELIDVKDSKFGMNLLSLSIANNKRKSFKELIANGANVNEICGVNSKTTPLIVAIDFLNDCDAFFVKELLKKKCDVNLKVVSINQKVTISEDLALFSSISCIEVFKLLINNGADLNSTIIIPPFKKPFSLIDICLKNKELDVLFYLFKEEKIEVPNEIELETIDGITSVNLIEYLKSEKFNFLDSPDFQIKREQLIKFLQQKQK